VLTTTFRSSRSFARSTSRKATRWKVDFRLIGGCPESHLLRDNSCRPHKIFANAVAERTVLMHTSHYLGGPALLYAILVSASTMVKTPVWYPEGYRSWQHIKSILIGPEHPTFEHRGGLHHYYANDLAVIGYQTGRFPDGSVIVDENVLTKDGEGQAKGILLEGDRRMIEVMVKDRGRYKETSGWGFERFEYTRKDGALSAEQQTQCYECHAKAQDRDLVFSTIRP
jgi:hypothetical protein